jgi:hypothetical protein
VENEVGAVSPGHRMDKMILALNPGDEQDRALDALIAAQQDPHSPFYRQWLTPEQVADQFGVSENDVDQVKAWLESHGFTIDEVPAGRRTIVFSGTAGMVEAAFHTEMKQYRVNGELHDANASDPQIPEALAAVVKGTVTLHDFARRSMTTAKQSVAEYSSGGTYYLAPADFATIYNRRHREIDCDRRPHQHQFVRCADVPQLLRTAGEQSADYFERNESGNHFRCGRGGAGCRVVRCGGARRDGEVRGVGIDQFNRRRGSFGAVYRDQQRRAGLEHQLWKL